MPLLIAPSNVRRSKQGPQNQWPIFLTPRMSWPMSWPLLHTSLNACTVTAHLETRLAPPKPDKNHGTVSCNMIESAQDQTGRCVRFSCE
jgi:hypothetical protein